MHSPRCFATEICGFETTSFLGIAVRIKLTGDSRSASRTRGLENKKFFLRDAAFTFSSFQIKFLSACEKPSLHLAENRLDVPRQSRKVGDAYATYLRYEDLQEWIPTTPVPPCWLECSLSIRWHIMDPKKMVPVPRRPSYVEQHETRETQLGMHLSIKPVTWKFGKEGPISKSALRVEVAATNNCEGRVTLQENVRPFDL